MVTRTETTQMSIGGGVGKIHSGTQRKLEKYRAIQWIRLRSLEDSRKVRKAHFRIMLRHDSFLFLVNCKWRVYKSLLRLMLSGLWVPHCQRQRVSHTSSLTAAPLASCACGSPGPCPPADWKGMAVRGAEPQQRSTQTLEIMPHWFSISESRDRFQTSLGP